MNAPVVSPPLTERQLALLRRGCEGVCIKGRWHWHFDGEPAGVAVKRLLNLGLASAMYFSGGRGAINATDAGRDYIASVKAAA